MNLNPYPIIISQFKYKLYLYFIKIYIIIIACRQHGFLLLFLTICPYHPSHLLSPLDCTQCSHRTDKYVFAGWRKLLMSLSLLLQQWSVYLSWMVSEMGDKWPYNCWFVGCCFLNLFKTTCNILVYFPCSFFSRQVVQQYTCTDMATT